MKKKLVVLTGAGMSVESGLSTFRDSGGLWDRYPVEDVATPEGWERNPALVQGFYNKRRKELLTVEPNAGHKGLAELEKEYDVTIITQNVDNLHERAGSTHVLHLHGELTKIRPENTCNDRDGFSEKYVVDIGYGRVSLGDLAPNGAQYRPHIVFFGEAVPKIERAIDLVSRCDVMLIVGTSLQVYPAAGLYRYAPADTPVYIVDPAPLPVRDKRVTHIRKVATEGVKECLEILK